MKCDICKCNVPSATTETIERFATVVVCSYCFDLPKPKATGSPWVSSPKASHVVRRRKRGGQ